jgi:neprilysin
VISQGENIADNGGIREAYRAYKTFTAEHGAEKRLPGLEQYSADQIFFISYASIWCGRETPERLKYQIQTGAFLVELAASLHANVIKLYMKR